jgi:predicted transcriptional regulator of viral defense system
MNAVNTPKSLSKKAHLPALFRSVDLEARGIPRGHVRALIRHGEVERVGRGIYRLAAVEPHLLETVATVAAAIPGGVICLLTALRIHDIGTQSPPDVWIAIDRKRRKPIHLPTKVRIVRFSGAMLTYGVIRRTVLGVPISITSSARTVVDCFRYRNKVGLDVAMEALRDAVRGRKTTIAEISRVADACRIRTVIGPYLDVFSV